MVCSEASALASSSACTIVVWPTAAAFIRAVPPTVSCRLTLAPRCSSIRTTAFCPPSAAAITSVSSSRSAQRASTPPPPFSHVATTCASPLCAAMNMVPGSPASAATGLGTLADEADLAAAVEGATLAFCFLPLPFVAAASFSAASSASSSVAAASDVAAACAAAAAALASASAACRSACCRSSCAAARGVGLGVEQRLHSRGVAIVSSVHQGGDAEGVLQVDARAAPQQHPYYRLLPSPGSDHQQRCVV
eukprot:scaffold59376_cov84-Phaeocystis_antarctica.AAC.2